MFRLLLIIWGAVFNLLADPRKALNKDEHLSSRKQKDIRKQASKIVQNGWNPRLVMIDKDRAELNAIREGTTDVRLLRLYC